MPELFVKLVDQGVPVAIAHDLVALLESVASLRELQEKVGEPDGIEHWDEATSHGMATAVGVPVERVMRWRVRWDYRRRWFPACVSVFEHEDGHISYAVAVIPPNGPMLPAVELPRRTAEGGARGGDRRSWRALLRLWWGR